jgi:GNAT superfamily N-acetyltransferase
MPFIIMLFLLSPSVVPSLYKRNKQLNNIAALIFAASFFLTTLPFTESFTAITTTTTIMSSTNNKYLIRPYDPSIDRSSLDEICASETNDYLPKMADTYMNDASCSLLTLATMTTTGEEEYRQQQPQEDGVLEEEKKDGDSSSTTIVAIANYKRLTAQNAAWIEAVRTHSKYRNQGLASKLLQSMIELARDEDMTRNSNNQQENYPPTNILTCTVQSNVGMQRVLEKLGFVQTNTIAVLKFSTLKALPGWSTGDTTKIQGKPLLDALDLHHLISQDAKSVPTSSWTSVTTEEQLLKLLAQMKNEGGTCGFLPGLYEYIVPSPNRVDLKQSLEQGLVFALDIVVANNERSERAILAFTQDKRISTLKSNWVCSISAYSTLAFEAALHYAHSSDVAQRFGRTTEMIPFCLVFDDAVPIVEGNLAHALPRVDDECVVFSYKHMM